MRQLTEIASNFLTASKSFEHDPMRLTLVTQLSLSRMNQLEDLAKAWRGPISAALLVQQKSDWKQVVVYYKQSKFTHTYVDIHLVVSSFSLVRCPKLR